MIRPSGKGDDILFRIPRPQLRVKGWDAKKNVWLADQQKLMAGTAERCRDSSKGKRFFGLDHGAHFRNPGSDYFKIFALAVRLSLWNSSLFTLSVIGWGIHQE